MTSTDRPFRGFTSDEDHGWRLHDRRLDDIGNSRRLIETYGANIRFIVPLSRWLVWDGIGWRVDGDAVAVRELAKNTVRAIEQEAAAADGKIRKPLRQHATRSASVGGIRAMLKHAESDPDVRIDDLALLDADPLLVGTATGVLDLRTGHVRPAERADLITMRTAGGIRPNTTAPRFTAFLERILPDREVRDYLQRVFGLALIGETREHVLPVLFGAGANGKTVLVETMLYVFGDYGSKASLDLLMAGRRNLGAATPELVQLRARRLVVTSETEEGAKLNVAKVKDLTGGDTISARDLYQPPVEFAPTHTVVLATNHRPRVPESTVAAWRRIRLVPFTVTIPPDEDDRTLKAQLRAEADGILRWVVDGARAYLERGLADPDSVLAATDDYRADEDSFADFLAERTIPDETGTVRTSALQAAYAAWAKEHGEPELSAQAIGERLARLHYERARIGATRAKGWHGLRLAGDHTQHAMDTET